MQSKPTKRGQIRAVWKADGVEAAVKKGEAMGVRAGRVNRWIKLWSRKETPPPPRPPIPSKKGKKRKGPINVGDRVCLTYNPDALGRLVGKGEEQSDIKWLSNGRVYAVPNEWIMLAD